MTDAPELPTLFRHGSGVYDLVPDVRPLTWSLWDRDGCIGEIAVNRGTWTARDVSGHLLDGRHAAWQDALVALLALPLS